MKNFTLLLVFFLTTFLAFAQTSLTAGDIAFLGVNTDGVTDADDSFAFVLLKDVEANTTITFTDRGWNDGTGFVEPLAIGDGELIWTSTTALSVGEVVILNFANLSPGAAVFTVLGDQLFAIQGTISSPIFIAGMQLNIGVGSDDANWDGAATSNTTSALPDALTTGDTAIRFPIEQDNWQFSCSTGLCPLSGTAEEIRAILHNPANWINDNTNVFPGTVNVNLGTITVGPVNTPPTITSSSTANVEENQTIAIHVEASDDIDIEGPGLTYSLTGDGVDQLLFNINEVTGEVSFMNAPDFENPEDEGGNNIYEFQVTVTDSGGLASMQDISITVTNVDDTSPTISSLTPFSGATDVAVDANLVVEFNEEVQAVSGNNIIILANLVPVVTIPIDDSQVTIGGSTLTIIPIADLPSNASISVGIPDGGLKDLAGNDFRGIDPTTGWVFTTAVPVDNTPPVITCPGDIVFDSFSSVECGDIVNWDAPIVTDNFPGVTVTSNFNSGDLFPIGTTEVVYTATDAAGNQAECKFMVTVNDAKAPTPICINGLTVTLDATTGLQTIAATDFIASPITDACGPVTYTISRATVDPNSDVRSSSLILNCDDEETTLIRVWAEDKNGNSDFCETYILVDKSQFMCPAPLIVDLELDVTTLNPTPVVSGAIVNYLYTLTNKGSSTATGIEVEVIFPTGINFISSGFPGGTFFNFTTKIWSIPSLAAGITRTLVISGNVNGNGDYMTLAEVIAQNETDIDSTPGNGVDTDGDGNVIDDPEDEDDGDAETVTPIDNDPPVAVCQDVMVQLDPNGNTTVSVTDIDNGSTDNGAIVSYGVRRSVARMFDQNATPDAIFGSGNANGSFTNNQTGSVELGLRAKVRYPTPMNTFNSNGDGTYQHLAIAGSPASRAGWNFEWSVNTDPSGTAGDKLSGLTYEMGIDFDASTGTDYYVFDPINQPFADHAIGTNMTANGGGVEATDPASYAGLLAANNVAQNSWNLDFFNELAGKTFDPTVDGTYEVYLKAFDGSGAKVGETKITVIVGNGGAPGLLPQSIDFTNADIGTNLVELIVVDAAGNTAICTSTVTVKSACEVVIEAQPMDVVVCEKEPYSFRVEATGNGMLSYQWEYLFAVDASWDTYPNATENVLDIPAQGAVIHADGWLFRVRVTSDNGTPNDATDDCTTTSETATLTVNPLPVVEITGKDSYCNNGNGVVLDAGAGHSSYLWSPGGETTQTITALEGSYTVEVTYEFGCIKTSEAFMVTNNQPLDCNILQDVLATDHLTNDGVATVNITGGTGHYMYLWDNGETTQTATTLTYGMHSVTVTDSNGCETTCQIDIAKELYCWTNLVQNVSIRGGNDGAARVKGNGGYRPYTYKWEDGSTNEVNSTLTPGTHYVTITDASGATSQCSVIITEPTGGDCDTFILNVEQDKLSTDHLTADGVATVHPKGGAAQYTYLWDNGERTQTASKLTYGVHSVTVTDANGCEASSQIDIAKELYCWTNLIKNESSYGSNDGAAQVRGNGGYRPYTFKWDDGSSEELNSSLGAGTHYVTITDATGATSRCSVIIEGPNQEICDGIDNDGDGKIDEGFDQDGDGIADCFDICSQGDDHVDMDYDGIPDACDDNICVKGEKPKTECYQTAVWNIQTCSWDITGEQPEMPMTECYQTAVWNNATCTWDI
ncbi:SprB repeat-containing protein, partial [Maribacter sedimenticola]